MTQAKTQATSLLKNLVDENNAEGGMILLSVGGEVVSISLGKMDFTKTLTAFASACAKTSS